MVNGYTLNNYLRKLKSITEKKPQLTYLLASIFYHNYKIVTHFNETLKINTKKTEGLNRYLCIKCKSYLNVL